MAKIVGNPKVQLNLTFSVDEQEARALDALAELAEPGPAGTPSPRFFGFVIGGTYPVAIAADWLTSAGPR